MAAAVVIVVALVSSPGTPDRKGSVLSPTPEAGRRRRPRRIAAPVALVTLAVLALTAATGCGSSKPSYCADRGNLESSVKDLPSAARTGGTGGLQSQLTTIESAATAAIDSAKSDFPTETSTLKTTVDQLKTGVEGLPASPSVADLAPVALNATAVVNAVKGFTSATKSKCE
jgi:hypothetical protein